MEIMGTPSRHYEGSGKSAGFGSVPLNVLPALRTYADLPLTRYAELLAPATDDMIVAPDALLTTLDFRAEASAPPESFYL